MGGVGHEDYYPRLCDCSRRRCDDRFWALGVLHSDQGKGRSEALHSDDANNSCRSCPDWPCPGLAPVTRVGGLPVNDLRLAMPLYWLVYRHSNQNSLVIEPGVSSVMPLYGLRSLGWIRVSSPRASVGIGTLVFAVIHFACLVPLFSHAKLSAVRRGWMLPAIAVGKLVTQCESVGEAFALDDIFGSHHYPALFT